MKFIPTLFSTPMVQALLDESKKQTRRIKGLDIFNKNKDCWRYDGINEEDGRHYMELISISGNPLEHYFEIVCPFGEIGDVLWVREKHRAIVNCSDGTFSRWDYYADFPDKYHKQYPSKWKPSLFMPKTACRLFLKIKDIRVERLHDISEADIKAEGVKIPTNNGSPLFALGRENSAWSFMSEKFKTTATNNYSLYELFFAHWAELWCKINGRQSWDDNPWVWVIEFEKIEKPANFI